MDNARSEFTTTSYKTECINFEYICVDGYMQGQIEYRSRIEN